MPRYRERHKGKLTRSIIATSTAYVAISGNGAADAAMQTPAFHVTPPRTLVLVYSSVRLPVCPLYRQYLRGLVSSPLSSTLVPELHTSP